MILLLKGFIIGIGKIIPGVSGAMLAINFKVYERALEAVTNFFSDWKSNLKFILLLGIGVMLSVITCSNIVIYLLNNYFFVTMMFFIGLIVGGTYNFSLGIRYSKKNIWLCILVILLFMLISFGNIDNNYILRGNFIDNVMFFIGGIIEIFSSIVPGISGTALLMIMGVYEDILVLISRVFDFGYVIDNIGLYLSYGIGMIVSFIVNSYLISYFIKRYKNSTYLVILSLCIGSILFLGVRAFGVSFTLVEFIIGIMLLFLGLLLSCILDK